MHEIDRITAVLDHAKFIAMSFTEAIEDPSLYNILITFC